MAFERIQSVVGDGNMTTIDEQYLGEGLVFVVGCPRSGTTWLQKMLTGLPAVATGQESDIFDQYIGPQLRHWKRDMDQSTSGRSAVGLGCHLLEDEFHAALRRFMLELLTPLVQAIPQGGLYIEKTPSHALFLPEIQHMLPQAKVVHMIRDCRDVCASILSAGKSWGKSWASSNAASAARMWVTHVHNARVAGRAFPANMYSEVRYEEFKAHPEEMLGNLAAWLGIDAPEETLAAAVHATRPGSKDSPHIPVGGEWALRTSQDVVREPEGFIRKARAGSWREDLSLLQRFQIWMVARKVMATVDYPWNAPW